MWHIHLRKIKENEADCVGSFHCLFWDYFWTWNAKYRLHLIPPSTTTPAQCFALKVIPGEANAHNSVIQKRSVLYWISLRWKVLRAHAKLTFFLVLSSQWVYLCPVWCERWKMTSEYRLMCFASDSLAHHLGSLPVNDFIKMKKAAGLLLCH